MGQESLDKVQVPGNQGKSLMNFMSDAFSGASITQKQLRAERHGEQTST